MSHQLTIWRAAQLVGVSRAALQQQVRSGALELHDGWITTESLLALYPHTQLEESGLLEKVTTIRDEAFGKRIRERLLPRQEVLAQRLFEQTQELGDTRRQLQGYHQLVMDLRGRIHAASLAHPESGEWQQLRQAIDQGLGRALATQRADALTVMDDMLKVMTAQVTVRPSGREFQVEGHDTLLQAGLRAGLLLNYGCGNGTCGMCKVRVISGEVVRTQACDYPLSETERAQGYTLMCAHTAASSELTLELLEARGPSDIPVQHIVTTVRAVKLLGADTLHLHLQTPRSHRLRFMAGQMVELATAQGADTTEPALYPIASCPCDDRNLHFFMGRAQNDALVEQLLCGQIKVGDSLPLSGPTGDFVLADTARPLVFAACDLGFGPVKSLIEHALALDQAQALSLFWLATRPDGHFAANQCRAWSQALDQFECEMQTSDDVGHGAQALGEAMRRDLFDIECDFYLCGPQTFVDVLLALLRHAGVPAAQIHTLTLLHASTPS